MELAQVTLAVLAGGRSRRMGRDKSHLQIGDRGILEFLLERIGWAGPTVLVTAPGVERPPGAERFGVVAADAVADQGPLRGVMTALEVAATPMVVVATVDMPNIGAMQLEWLQSRLEAHPRCLGMMSVHGGQIEPFPMAIRAEARGILEERLAAGLRSVQSLSALPRFGMEAAPGEWGAEVWVNLNSSGDYERFLAGLNQSMQHSTSNIQHSTLNGGQGLG